MTLLLTLELMDDILVIGCLRVRRYTRGYAVILMSAECIDLSRVLLRG